mmetsp:Transcript_12784/g.30311  ORF Transcript_12784/g.30311 Transcript_12784/m.30311 type:complete len:277 (-) Transcript_12784:637-1467(-)
MSATVLSWSFGYGRPGTLSWSSARSGSARAAASASASSARRRNTLLHAGSGSSAAERRDGGGSSPPVRPSLSRSSMGIHSQGVSRAGLRPSTFSPHDVAWSRDTAVCASQVSRPACVARTRDARETSASHARHAPVSLSSCGPSGSAPAGVRRAQLLQRQKQVAQTLATSPQKRSIHPNVDGDACMRQPASDATVSGRTFETSLSLQRAPSTCLASCSSHHICADQRRRLGPADWLSCAGGLNEPHWQAQMPDARAAQRGSDTESAASFSASSAAA